MQKNIINVVTKVYKFFIAGMVFWWYLIKGLIVYGLYKSICSLFMVVDELCDDLEDRFVLNIYREVSKKFDSYKIESFITWLYFTLLSICIYYLQSVPGTISSVLLFLSLYLVLLGIILVTYTAYYLAYREVSFKQGLVLAFVNSFKKPMGSIAVFFIVLISAYIGYLNLVALIFIVPSLYGLVVKLLFINRLSK